MSDVSNGTIDRHTKITLGVAIGVMGVVLTIGGIFLRWSVQDAAWKERDAAWKERASERYDSIEQQVEDINSRVVIRSWDAWHRQQMRWWVERTKVSNPGWVPAVVDDVP